MIYLSVSICYLSPGMRGVLWVAMGWVLMPLEKARVD